MQSTPSKSAPEPAPKKKRRWRRRLLIALGVIVLVLVLVVALLPTIVTSSWVEKKVAAIGSEKLGRPLVFDGLEFGWTTDLRLARMEIRDEKGESGRPVFILHDVHVPVSLGGLVVHRLPVALKGITIGEIEANVVRADDGEWNVLKIKKALDAGKKPEPPPPPKPPKTGPMVLPVSDLSLTIKKLNVRFIDPKGGLTAGWESGSIDVQWPGGIQPLTGDIGGVLRVNEQEMPWDIRMKVAHWIDAQRVPTPMETELTIASDGMVDEEQIAEGGFFVFATGKEGVEDAIRIAMPLDKIYELAHAAPQGAKVPALAGTLDLRVHATQRGAFKTWDTRIDLAGRGLHAVLPDMNVPPQDFDAHVATHADLNAREVTDFKANVDTKPLQLAATVARVPLDNPLGTTGVLASATLDFGAATMLASTIRGGTGEPVATGSAHVEITEKALTADGGALEVVLDVKPEELRTLLPFARNEPAFLQAGPLTLEPLTTHAKLGVALDKTKQTVAVSLDEWKNAILTEFALSIAGDGVKKSGQLETSGSVDLAMPTETWGPRFKPENRPTVKGAIPFKVKAVAEGPKKFSSEGNVGLRGLHVEIPEPQRFLDVPETTFAWDLSIDNEKPEVAIRRVSLENALAQWHLDGTMTDRFDLRTSLTASLEPIMELAATFKPLPGTAGGEVRVDGTLKGKAGERLDIGVGVATPRALSWKQEGLVNLEAPLEVESTTSLLWKNDAPSTVTLQLAKARFGEILDAHGDAEVALGNGGDIDVLGGARIQYAPILGLLDPAVLEKYSTQVAVEGETNVDVSVHGAYKKTPEAVEYPIPMIIKGTVKTDLASVEWMFKEMDGIVEGFSDDRAFGVTLLPSAPKEFHYRDASRTGIESVDGPMGLKVGEWFADTTIDATMARTKFELKDFELESVRFAKDGMELALPKATAKARVGFEMEKKALAVDGAEFTMGEELRVDSSARFNATDKTWGTDTHVALSSLDGLIGWVTLPPEKRAMIPKLAGSAELDAKLSGSVPGEGFDPKTSPLPVDGTLSATVKDFSLSMPKVQVQGLNVTVGTKTEGATRHFLVESGLTIERVANPALPIKPLRDIKVTASAEMSDLDDLKFAIPEASIGNYGSAASAEVALTGLTKALADKDAAPMARWLGNLTIRGKAHTSQDLAMISGIHPAMFLSGTASMGGEFLNEPQRGMTLTTEVGAENVDVLFKDMVEMRGVTGAWTSRKSLLKTGLIPESPPEAPGVFTVREAAFGPPGRPGLKARLKQTQIYLTGFDDPFSARMEVRDLMGGNGEVVMGLDLAGADPLVTGDVQVAGLDAGQLGGLQGSDRPSREINGAGTITWRMRPVGLQRSIEEMNARMESSRIGRDAFIRLLEALDADQDDPRFQNARAALRFGTPTGAYAGLDNGLVSFRGELGVPGGISMPLPILERQPLGDLIQVYNMDRFDAPFALGRAGLLFLLAENLQEFEQNLVLLEKKP